MLDQLFSNQLMLGIAQALIACLLALIVGLVARWQSIRLEKEIIIAVARGSVQIVAVGSILSVLLQAPVWTSVLVLFAMIIAAATIAAQRAKGLPGAFPVSLYGIAFGSGLVILLMTWLGVINSQVSSLIPVGSMIIANCMNTNSLALDRFRGELKTHVGQIEAGISLGASPAVVVSPYVQQSIQASLIPRLDSMRSLGIVWIPGLMAGMVLAGTDPVYAAIYQFVVIALIFSSSALTALVSVLLIRERVFSQAEQLLIKPE